MKDSVVIKTFNTRPEAEIVKGFLETNNIHAMITADDEGGMAPFPFQPTSIGIKLLVNKKDLDKATELLKE